MGAGLLGAIAGAGRGAVNVSDTMKQDRLRSEDNLIWETRQLRLQELGLETAERTQAIADASESKRNARDVKTQDRRTKEERAHQAKVTTGEREYKAGLLPDERAREDEVRQQELGADISKKNVQHLLDIQKGKEFSGMGYTPSGAKKGGSDADGTNKAKVMQEYIAMGHPPNVARARAYGDLIEMKDPDGITTILIDRTLGIVAGELLEDAKSPGGYRWKENPEWAQRGNGDPNPGGGSPYPDGTKLTGKDGKKYIVQDGKPVLAE